MLAAKISIGTRGAGSKLAKSVPRRWGSTDCRQTDMYQRSRKPTTAARINSATFQLRADAGNEPEPNACDAIDGGRMRKIIPQTDALRSVR